MPLSGLDWTGLDKTGSRNKILIIMYDFREGGKKRLNGKANVWDELIRQDYHAPCMYATKGILYFVSLALKLR